MDSPQENSNTNTNTVTSVDETDTAVDYCKSAKINILLQGCPEFDYMLLSAYFSVFVTTVSLCIFSFFWYLCRLNVFCKCLCFCGEIDRWTD